MKSVLRGNLLCEFGCSDKCTSSADFQVKSLFFLFFFFCRKKFIVGVHRC